MAARCKPCHPNPEKPNVQPLIVLLTDSNVSRIPGSNDIKLWAMSHGTFLLRKIKFEAQGPIYTKDQLLSEFDLYPSALCCLCLPPKPPPHICRRTPDHLQDFLNHNYSAAFIWSGACDDVVTPYFYNQCWSLNCNRLRGLVRCVSNRTF